MHSSRFESLPVELRMLIFYFYFGTIRVKVKRIGKYRGRLQIRSNNIRSRLPILSTSQLIRKEACNVLGSLLELRLQGCAPDEVPKPIQRYYYHLVQNLTVTISSKKNVDLSAFTRLKILHLQENAEPLPGRFWLRHVKRDEKAWKCLEGGVDEKLKNAARHRFLTSKKWVRDFLQQTERGFRIQTLIQVYWGPNEAISNSMRLRQLYLTFDLDTLETVRRDVYHFNEIALDRVPFYHTIWERDLFTLWRQAADGTLQCVRRRPWHREEQDELSRHPDLVGVTVHHTCAD